MLSLPLPSAALLQTGPGRSTLMQDLERQSSRCAVHVDTTLLMAGTTAVSNCPPEQACLSEQACLLTNVNSCPQLSFTCLGEVHFSAALLMHARRFSAALLMQARPALLPHSAQIPEENSPGPCATA